MAHGKASNQSLYSTNDLSSRVRNRVRSAGPSATTICNAYRKALVSNPNLIFSEWKREYMKQYWKNKKK